jgi:hypothetical protein
MEDFNSHDAQSDHRIHPTNTDNEGLRSKLHGPQGHKTVISTPHHTFSTPFTKVPFSRKRHLTSSYSQGISNSNLPTSPCQRLIPAFTTSPVISKPSSPGLHKSSLQVQMTHSSTISSFQGREYNQSRPSSLPSISNPQSMSTSSSSHGGTTILPASKRSVKHLTCFWWKQKGRCRFSDEECLYAHHDTGIYTEPPRQLIPGEPALAGRSLDRALKKLQQEHNKSPNSLSSFSKSRPTTPGATLLDNQQTLVTSERPNSRDSDVVVAAVDHDKLFLRDLVEQGTKEKAVLLSTIESLQNENKG